MPLTFADGLLPPGIHAATLDEIGAELARTDRRAVLFENLKRYVADLRLTGWECRLIIDGSFITPTVDKPNDIDAVLILPPDWNLNRRGFRPFEYNLLAVRRTRASFAMEVFPVLPGSDDERKFIALFSSIRPEWCREFGWPLDSLKGLVEVVP